MYLTGMWDGLELPYCRSELNAKNSMFWVFLKVFFPDIQGWAGSESWACKHSKFVFKRKSNKLQVILEMPNWGSLMGFLELSWDCRVNGYLDLTYQSEGNVFYFSCLCQQIIASTKGNYIAISILIALTLTSLFYGSITHKCWLFYTQFYLHVKKQVICLVITLLNVLMSFSLSE